MMEEKEYSIFERKRLFNGGIKENGRYTKKGDEEGNRGVKNK